MIFNRLSLVCFAISFVAMGLIFSRTLVFGLSYDTILRYGVIYVGMLGFLFSILSIYFDKKRKPVTNKNKGVLFYVGAGVVMLGVVFRLMHWPYASLLIIAGLLISLMVTLFGRFLNPPEKQEDLLDN